MLEIIVVMDAALFDMELLIIHVVDLAKGHLAAMRRFNLHTKSRGFESYNLGTGQGTSVLELVKAFREASGMEIPTGSIQEKVINNIGFSVHR